jgi:hypothetical protein
MFASRPSCSDSESPRTHFARAQVEETVGEDGEVEEQAGGKRCYN